MAKVKASELRSKIDALPAGEEFFLNSICLSVKAIDSLREMIKDGKVRPDTEYFNYSDKVGVLTGDVILPQNNYWKN